MIPWFDNKGLQVIEEIKKALGSQKCAVGLVAAGISAFVVMLTASCFSEFVSVYSECRIC